MTVSPGDYPDFRRSPHKPGALKRPEPTPEEERLIPRRLQGMPLADQQEVIRRAMVVTDFCRRSPWIPHDPHPKQAIFLALDTREALFGGQAGPGKSDALLMAAAMHVDTHPAYAGLLLRKSFSDLTLPGALMDRAGEWWGGTAAHWSALTKTWSFPTGATVTFGYLQNSIDKFRYQSSEFQFVGWDELTQFLELDYRYMFSRLRRTQDITVPLHMRAASNPGNIGNEWVKKRFIDAHNPRRVFIPATLDDNPYIDREAYIESLGELDPMTLRQLLHGDWGVVSAGTMFNRATFPTIEVEMLPRIRHWLRFWDCAASPVTRQSPDPDWTVGVLLGQDYFDRVYVVDVVRGRWAPQGVENVILQTAKEDGREVSIRMEQEGGASGKIVADSYARMLLGHDFEAVPSTGDKEVRARPVSAAGARGEVILVNNGQRFRDWFSPFMAELEAFKSIGVHDDQVDALSGAFSSLDFRTDVGSDLATRNRELGETRSIPEPTGRRLTIGTGVI